MLDPLLVLYTKQTVKTQWKTREQIYNNKPLLNFENRYLTKSGEIVWLSWTSMPLDSEKLVYAIAKNITHKKKSRRRTKFTSCQSYTN